MRSVAATKAMARRTAPSGSVTTENGVSVRERAGLVRAATSASIRDPPKPESARRMMTSFRDISRAISSSRPTSGASTMRATSAAATDRHAWRASTRKPRGSRPPTRPMRARFVEELVGHDRRDRDVDEDLARLRDAREPRRPRWARPREGGGRRATPPCPPRCRRTPSRTPRRAPPRARHTSRSSPGSPPPSSPPRPTRTPPRRTTTESRETQPDGPLDERLQPRRSLGRSVAVAQGARQSARDCRGNLLPFY